MATLVSVGLHLALYFSVPIYPLDSSTIPVNFTTIEFRCNQGDIYFSKQNLAICPQVEDLKPTNTTFLNVANVLRLRRRQFLYLNPRKKLRTAASTQ